MDPVSELFRRSTCRRDNRVHYIKKKKKKKEGREMVAKNLVYCSLIFETHYIRNLLVYIWTPQPIFLSDI